MAINREDFFAAKAKGSLWDVAVSIKRGNPLPLDADSIFESYAALEAYAADVLAYPGQVVAVVNADSTGIYYLDQNCAINPVGIIPQGDSKSIEVTEAGVISLFGAGDAENGTLPMIENGVLTWKTLEDIGAGDGNDNTTYEITALEKGEGEAAETYGIQIQVKENGIASGEPIVIDFDVYTKSETDALIEGLDSRIEALEEKEDKDTTYSVKEGEKILKLEGTEFSTVASLNYVEATETTGPKIQLLGIDDTLISEIDATPFIKDGMLHDVDYDPETNKLIFTWNTDEGQKTDEVILSDIIEPYTAGNGLSLSGNEFGIKIATGSESFLTADANGLKLAGVQEAINAAEGRAAQDAADKAAQALADAKADAANLYAAKTYVGNIPDNYTETNVISYINKKAEETLAAAQGGSSETAASVKQQLDNYKSENDTKVNANTAAIGTINEKLATIDTDADVNVIEVVKVNGSALTVTEKAVDIAVPTALSQLEGYSSIDERITSAKNQADKGVADAGAAQAKADANEEEIGKHETRIGALETAKGDHETRILSLESASSQHTSEYTALKGVVDGHTGAIATKAEQSTVDGVIAKASANETAIKTINETTIPGVLTEVGKKANAADVYTKTEIGAIAEGKTIVGMIADAQSAATYNDSEVRGLIANNASAIGAIYTAGTEGAAATGVLATEIARVEGLLTAETNRADGVEKGLDSRLQTVEAFWKAAQADGTDSNVIDTLKEIQDYIASDETGASNMLASIQANEAAIKNIFTPANGETPASGMLVSEIARVEGLTATNAQAIAAINHSETGILATAKKYTDDKIAAIPVAGSLLGLVKSSEDDNKIKVETDGTMSVNRVSVDKLYIEDGSELVLNGGNAV